MNTEIYLLTVPGMVVIAALILFWHVNRVGGG